MSLKGIPMKKNSVLIPCTIVLLLLLVSPIAVLAQQPQLPFSTVPSAQTVNPGIPHTLCTPAGVTDFDPLVDEIVVTVAVHEIRALKTIDVLSDPDFYVQVTINDKEFTSPVWQNMKYVEHPNWSAAVQVPKDTEFVDITIALWDKNLIIDRLCDISPKITGDQAHQYIATLTYSIATGVWWGDDCLGDASGYGRLNGCDDTTIYPEDRDCEMWFDITQNDFDGDGFPFWLETNMYNTSPTVDNRGEDADDDGIPIEWEYTFGLTYIDWGYDSGYHMVYDPFTWENHSDMDDDVDGLTNVEEYKTWQWGSDPFRQDIFIELDQMEAGPNGEGSFVPVGAFDMIRDSHAKQNIVWHVDDGRLGGGETIPYKEVIAEEDHAEWYWKYFMHEDENNWRRGVFRWGLIAYNWSWAKGFCFSSRINNSSALDCFFLSTKYHDSRVKNVPLIDSLIRKTFDSEKQRAFIYAGAIMHETGHTLAIWNRGVDNRRAVWPWQLGFYRFASYKSVMNYRYIYTDLVDYSDGSHGRNDFNDWADMDLTRFNPRAAPVEAVFAELL